MIMSRYTALVSFHFYSIEQIKSKSCCIISEQKNRPIGKKETFTTKFYHIQLLYRCLCVVCVPVCLKLRT